MNRFSSCRDASSGDAKAREKLVHNDFVLEVWTLSNWNQRWSISGSGCEKAQLQGRNYQNTDQNGDMDPFSLPSFSLFFHLSILPIWWFIFRHVRFEFLWCIQQRWQIAIKQLLLPFGEACQTVWWGPSFFFESLHPDQLHYPHLLGKGQKRTEVR